MNVKIYFHVFVLITIHAASAQNVNTAIGGRAAGLAYSTAVVEDEWALFNNVGGLAGVNQLSSAFAYEVRPALIGANRMAAAILAPSKIGTLGICIFRFGDDVYNEQQASMAFANRIGNTALGVKVNYTQCWAETFGYTNAISADFGGITRITSQLSVGAYIINLTQSKLTGIVGERLPTKLVAGIGFRPTDKILVASELEKDVEYLATWKCGIEYAIFNSVLFRTGFNLNPDAAYFGLGAQKKKLKFDYAIRFNQLIGTAHQASVIYGIRSKPKK